MSKPQSQTKKFPVQNFVIIIVAFLFIGILFGPNVGQVYSGVSATGSDTVELTNDGNLDTKVRDFSLTAAAGVDGNLKYIEFSPDESIISGSNVDMPMGLYINIPSGVSVDGGNVRITDQNNNKIPREIESFGSGNLMVWYKPSVTDGSDVVYRIWYGDTSAVEPAADSTYGSEAVWSAFVAVYLMNNDPNGDGANSIKDSTGNGHHGTPYGSMTTSDLINDVYGKEIDFDGTNDYISVPSHADFGFGTGDFTVFIRNTPNIDQINGVAYAGLIGIGDGHASDKWSLLTYESNQQTVISSNDGLLVGAATQGNVLSTVYSRRSGTHYLYIDGTEIDTDVTAKTYTASQLTIANSEYLLSQYMHGSISHIMVAKDGFSSDYIDNIRKNLNNPTAGGVGAFYKSIGAEYVVEIISPAVSVGDDKLYYDGILVSTLVYSDGSAYIDLSDVSASVKGSLPIIKVGTTQNIKIDHDLQYSITYVPKNMDITSPDMFRANEDMRIDTRLTDTSGNPVSNQPLEMRARLFDSDDDRYLDEIISSTSFVIPGKYIKSGKHYQLRLSYNGFEFGGWSNEILADFDVGTEGFTITSSFDKAPEGLAAASFAAASNLVGMAVTGWLDIPIIGDIIKFIADFIGVTL